MLTVLRIKNLALVEDLTLELQPGYNVITGETGAGKSILIGALNLALGERADRTLLREGGDACLVEAVFDVRRVKAQLKAFLEESGLEPCEDNQLVLRRSFTSGGANRQFVNGSPATLAALAAMGEWLVDIHGPHEHQSLLHPSRQLRILDAFGGLQEDRAAFAERARQRSDLEAEKAALVVDEKAYAQQLDLLRFQVAEITAAALRPGEDQEIERDYLRASNAAKLLQLSGAALQVLAEDDDSLLAQAGALGRTLQELQRVDPDAAALMSLHEQALGVFRDLQTELSRYADRVDLDPAQLRQLEERLNLLQSLKRKYGSTIDEITGFGQDTQSKLRQLEQRDAELARLNGALRQSTVAIERAGRDLSARRRKLIPRLVKAVSEQLADLGFKQSRFDIAMVSESELSNLNSPVPLAGFDTVEFQFAPNPGEAARPLRAIASSGELARVMLALKTVLAVEDEIPVLVFDEVDANVGGETANAVGEKMRQIAARRQVLCITHLPQVAAPASAHFVVTKQVKTGRTVTEIRPLEKSGRVAELTRMLGGQSAAARKHAEALLR